MAPFCRFQLISLYYSILNYITECVIQLLLIRSTKYYYCLFFVFFFFIKKKEKFQPVISTFSSPHFFFSSLVLILVYSIPFHSILLLLNNFFSIFSFHRSLIYFLFRFVSIRKLLLPLL